MRSQPLALVVLVTAFVPSSHGQIRLKKIATDHVDVGTVQIAVVRVPAGTFMIGSPLVIKPDDGWTASALSSIGRALARSWRPAPTSNH